MRDRGAQKWPDSGIGSPCFMGNALVEEQHLPQTDAYPHRNMT